MKCVHFFSQLTLALALFGSAGCAMFLVGAGAGAGAVAYAKGKLDTTEPASLDRVWEASLKSVKELEYIIIETNKHTTAARMVARNPRDEKLEISLKSASDKTTDVSIRVGAIGNEEQSRRVLDRIRRHIRD